MILTPFWSQGIGTEAVRQICWIAFRELALERIIGEVFPESLASARIIGIGPKHSPGADSTTIHRPGSMGYE